MAHAFFVQTRKNRNTPGIMPEVLRLKIYLRTLVREVGVVFN